MKLKEAFASHTDQEFPPKFVFCMFDTGEFHTIKVSNIEKLEDVFEFIGMSDEFEDTVFVNTSGAFPVIRLIELP